MCIYSLFLFFSQETLDSTIILNSKVKFSFWDNFIYIYSETYHNINLHLANFTWLKVEAKPLKIFAPIVQNSILTYVAHLIPRKALWNSLPYR